MPIPMKIWSQVGIDLICVTDTDDFEEDKRDYKYIYTAQCYFSKYIKIGALKTKTGVEVSTWIYENIFCQYGITDIHISDRGQEFVNNMARELYKKCGVKHRITTPYHPQANGMIARLNRTTGEMILKMMREENKQKDWVNYLPTVVFAVRTSKHSSTNYEPFMVMIGKKVKLPIDVTDEIDINVFKQPDMTSEEMDMLSNCITQENFHLLAEIQDSIFEDADRHIKANQKRQKRNYDLRFASGNVIKVGNVILKEKQKGLSRKGGKLNTKFFESTYTVLDIMNNGNYVLMSNKMNEILSTPCPMKHIKKYIQQDIDEELDAVNNPVSSTVSIPTSSMVSTAIMNEDGSMKVASLVNNLVSSTPIIPTTSTGYKKEATI